MKYDLKGYNIDNLLKTLYNKKIVLMNVERPSHDQVKFEIPDKFCKKAQKYITNFKAQKTANIIKRLPKILVANLGLVIALFVGAIFYFFAGNYVWQIRVFGVKDLNVADIVQVLKQNGVQTGKINVKSGQEIQTILLEHYDRLAQVSVVKKGTTIIINLSEKLVYELEEYQPIKANFNGIITSLDVVTGSLNVKIGDYVNKGDILVLPFNLDKSGNKISVKPMAEIQAKMFVVGASKLTKQDTVLTRTGKKQLTYEYYIFNHRIFCGKNKNSFALFENVSYNENVSSLVPLKRKVTCFYELAPTQIEHDFEAEKQSLVEKSQQEAQAKLPQNYELLDQQVKTEIVADTMYAYTIITIQGQIND